MQIEAAPKLDFKDVLIRPKRSKLTSRKDVELNRTFTFLHSGVCWTGVPIMAANMDGVGTYSMHHSLARHRMFTCLTKQTPLDQHLLKSSRDQPAYYAISTGISDQDWSRTQEIVNQTNPLFLCIDVANGYTEAFSEFIQKARETYPDITIIAGNVVTADMTQELLLSGADIIKVGIGPGSVCTTRIKTGVGYPQLSAIIECADAAHGLNGHIIADGGCTCPGDIAKAFGAGADFVMLGGMLAGHDESELEPKMGDDNKWCIEFYGNSSEEAMKRHKGGVANYRTSEGRKVRVPWRGPVDYTVRDILGSIRSTCTYVGARRLKELSKRTTFVCCSQQFNTSLL